MLLVTHFGNGDETDQDVLARYLQPFGSVQTLTVLPGTNYAHVQFHKVESSIALFEHLKVECKHANVAQVDDRYLVFFNTHLEKEKLKRHQIINFPDSVHAQSGSIPGLYIFDEFISKEEEQAIVTSLDNST